MEPSSPHLAGSLIDATIKILNYMWLIFFKHFNYLLKCLVSLLENTALPCSLYKMGLLQVHVFLLTCSFWTLSVQCYWSQLFPFPPTSLSPGHSLFIISSLIWSISSSFSIWSLVFVDQQWRELHSIKVGWFLKCGTGIAVRLSTASFPVQTEFPSCLFHGPRRD